MLRYRSNHYFHCFGNVHFLLLTSLHYCFRIFYEILLVSEFCFPGGKKTNFCSIFLRKRRQYYPPKWTFSDIFLPDVAICVHAKFQHQQKLNSFSYNQLTLHIRLLLFFCFLSKKMLWIQILLPICF